MSILKKLSVATAGAALVALGTIGKAQALTLNNSTGISNPASTVTFSELTFFEDTPITNQYASFGVSFSPNVFYRADGGSFPNQSGPTVDNFTNASFGADNVNPFSILFTQNQTSAAFAYVSNPGTTTFTARLNGAFVESFSAPTAADFSNPNNFYGFTGINFNEIAVQVSPSDNFDPLNRVDNIQLGTATAVPFEFSPGLGILALGAWGAVAQIKSKIKNRKPLTV